MKKIKIPKLLSISIIILIIVLYIATYTIISSNYVVEQNVIIFVILGLFIFAILGIIAIIKIYYKTEIKPEKALLFIMIPFCILILFAIPVGRGHDETIHWIKVFEISEGSLISPIDPETGVSTAFLPTGVDEIVNERSYGEFRYVDNIPLLNNKLNYNEKIKIENPRAESYCFIQYIPETAGVLIGKLITQNPLLIAYMARIGNIVTCIIIMYFAIKLIPFGKNVLLILATIPIAIEGFATISGDGITTSICALFIAYTFYLAFDKNKKCGKKEVLGIIKKIHEKGTTIIIVTHDMDVVMEYATKVVVLKDSRFIKMVTPNELFNSKDLSNYSLEIPSFYKFKRYLDEFGFNKDISNANTIDELVDVIGESYGK